MVAVAMNSLARSRCLLSAELSLLFLPFFPASSLPPPFDLPLLFLDPFLLPPSLPLNQLFRDTVLLPLSFRLWLNLDARSRDDSSRLQKFFSNLLTHSSQITFRNLFHSVSAS